MNDFEAHEGIERRARDALYIYIYTGRGNYSELHTSFVIEKMTMAYYELSPKSLKNIVSCRYIICNQFVLYYVKRGNQKKQKSTSSVGLQSTVYVDAR